MNKFIIYATILVAAMGAAVLVAGGPIQKTINGVDQQLSRLGNKVEVRIESMAHPPPHQPNGSRGILSSAFRGAGRLLRNVAGHAGVFAKNAAGSVAQTMSESKNRILYPKPIQPPPIIQPQTIIETVEIPESTEEQYNDEIPEEEGQSVVEDSDEAAAGAETEAAAPAAETAQAAEVAPEPATTEAVAATTEAAATEAVTEAAATTEPAKEASAAEETTTAKSD